MSEIIFTTTHGSRLYGFAHADSDFDTFTVTDSTSRRVKQSVDGEGNDRAIVGINRFLNLAVSGSHQSVEALFSPVKEWADTDSARKWRTLIESVRIGGPDVFEKYERTIRKFSHGDFKRRRHAVRLRLNLDELRMSQRIDRVCLTPAMVMYCTSLAGRLEGDDLAEELGVLRAPVTA